MAKRFTFVALLLMLAELVPLTLIDRDKSVFAIEADELVMLKEAGVSEAVVIAMLKSGREPQPLAPPPILDAFPTLVIVGHGPDEPNTFHQFSGFVSPM